MVPRRHQSAPGSAGRISLGARHDELEEGEIPFAQRPAPALEQLSLGLPVDAQDRSGAQPGINGES